MGETRAVYPPEWLALEEPYFRSWLLWTVADLAHDPATGLDWPPPATFDSDVRSSLEALDNDLLVLDIPATDLLGARLMDEAEVRALTRLAAALNNLIGPAQPLDFGRTPPFDRYPTGAEASRHPAWTEVAHAARAFYELLARWGVSTFDSAPPKAPPE